ncbi:hypothetical protein BKK50_04675 [Rodentibacter rarus]|uniref:Dynamin N-terminal domain-containing protein n=1 Tax=Rodentibacter rarus TaxID=1908260 RepID=A0A1V3INT2_9PAST|nr:dynamin family protein [Rodentibacter rarus]OOF43488.1 hypothetical protein BKK50_04675 [Rodentibacter rarus]
MNIVERISKIESFLNNPIIQNSDEFLAYALANKKGIKEKIELENDLKDMEDQSRLLRVGIIGRVKAGKSSLLNALLFDGENILPKAATPMTAALTIIEYGEKIQAEVDFFTQKDIDNIESEAKKYLKAFDQLKESKRDELRKQGKLATIQLEERAEKAAKREMKDHPYSASYDQYQRIKESQVSLSELKKFNNLEAETIEDLFNSKLAEFVGSNGRYMPFTKSVKIYIPNEKIKDLEIIDTPGLNDPVKSREERTEQLLSKCDVVFIVSPAGQFLSREDFQLISRVTGQAGIREIHLIASQSDMQFYGSEKRESISLTIDNLSKKLTGTLKNLNKDQNGKEESIGINETILNDLKKNNVICSSSIAFNLAKHLENPKKYDENEKFVWDNLKSHYSELDKNTDVVKETLLELSAIPKIEKIIKDVTVKKEDILCQRINDLISAQNNTIEEYIQKLSDYTQNKINEINNSNINELNNQVERLIDASENLSIEMNEKYNDVIWNYKRELDKDLNKYLDYHLSEFSPDDARDTKSETKTEYYDVKVKTFARKVWSVVTFGWGDDYTYETRSRDVTTQYRVVYANQIRDSIQRILNDLGESLNKVINNKRNALEKELRKEMEVAFNEFCQKYQLKLPKKSLLNAIDVVIKNLPDEKIKLDKNLPSEIDKGGVLRESEGDRFITESRNYLMNLKRNKEKEIDSKIENTISVLKNVELSKDLVSHLNKDITNLVRDIENKEESLRKWSNLNQEIKGL